MESAFQIGLRVVVSAQGDEFTVMAEESVHSSPGAVDRAIPFVVKPVRDRALVEMSVYYPDVVLERLIPLRPGWVILKDSYVAGKSVLKKSLFRGGAYNEEIVVEIDKMLCKVGNTVHVAFNNHRIEGGQKLLRNEILMVYDMKFRI